MSDVSLARGATHRARNESEAERDHNVVSLAKFDEKNSLETGAKISSAIRPYSKMSKEIAGKTPALNIQKFNKAQIDRSAFS